MQSLPVSANEYAEWKKVRVNMDYHVAIDKHYCSVPYQLVKEELDARIAASTVELLHKGKRRRSWWRPSSRPGRTRSTASGLVLASCA